MPESRQDSVVLGIEALDVCYGDVQVLFGLSLQVRAGELVAVIGSNGAGKTTLLRTISGLIRPTGGRICLNGRRLDGMPPHKIVDLGVSHVPEGRHLFPHMTVRENLQLGAVPFRARAHQQETLEWVTELFPRLGEREKQLAGTLSGGEQQMLAIGRALMARPSVLLLDEPSLGIAPVVVESLFETLQRVNQEGLTVVLVEQDAGAALELADRAYVLEHGKVVMEGGGADLLRDDLVRSAYLGM